MLGSFHRDLQMLKSLLLSMGDRAGEQLRRATRALLERDRAMAQHAIALDPDIDALEVRINEASANLAGCVLGPEIPLVLIDGGLERLAQRVLGMVPDGVDALSRANPQLARRVIAANATLEPLEQHVVRRLIAHAARAPVHIRAVFRLAYAARCLQRIGEHASGIAEMGAYVAEGVRDDHAGARPHGLAAARSPTPSEPTTK